MPVYSQLVNGTNGYNIDWNNISPNVGVAWRPNVQSGFLRTILGDPGAGDGSRRLLCPFERQGFGAFTGVYGGNPGGTLTLTRNANTGNWCPPANPWPILLSQKNRLGPGAVPEHADLSDRAPAEPRETASTVSIRTFRSRPRERGPLGFQRAVSRDMAVEVRYVGTRGVNQWSTLNYNERNLIENGFYDEFLKARANLPGACGGWLHRNAVRTRARSRIGDRAREPHPSRFTWPT